MARRIYYKIPEAPRIVIPDAQWGNVVRLQRWYNWEFRWTAGRLAFERYVVFPNWDACGGNERLLMERIGLRRLELRDMGYSDSAMVLQLEEDGLVLAKKGGYADGCLASGFTRVGGNEFNAYLVCEFLLHASRILKDIPISVVDEGRFIKCQKIQMINGAIHVPLGCDEEIILSQMVAERHLFAVVNPKKYDRTPMHHNQIDQYDRLENSEKSEILLDWNWLGFGNRFDTSEDDAEGYDLNKKVIEFKLAI